jgi:hypothetical protein
MMLGKRLPQSHAAAVGVAVQVAHGRLERRDGGGEGPERPLVRRQLDDPVEAELLLQLAHGTLRPVGLDGGQGFAQRHLSSLRLDGLCD